MGCSCSSQKKNDSDLAPGRARLKRKKRSSTSNNATRKRTKKRHSSSQFDESIRSADSSSSGSDRKKERADARSPSKEGPDGNPLQPPGERNIESMDGSCHSQDQSGEVDPRKSSVFTVTSTLRSQGGRSNGEDLHSSQFSTGTAVSVSGSPSTEPRRISTVSRSSLAIRKLEAANVSSDHLLTTNSSSNSISSAIGRNLAGEQLVAGASNSGRPLAVVSPTSFNNATRTAIAGSIMNDGFNSNSTSSSSGHRQDTDSKSSPNSSAHLVLSDRDLLLSRSQNRGRDTARNRIRRLVSRSGGRGGGGGDTMSVSCKSPSSVVSESGTWTPPPVRSLAHLDPKFGGANFFDRDTVQESPKKKTQPPVEDSCSLSSSISSDDSSTRSHESPYAEHLDAPEEELPCLTIHESRLLVIGVGLKASPTSSFSPTGTKIDVDGDTSTLFPISLPPPVAMEEQEHQAGQQPQQQQHDGSTTTSSQHQLNSSSTTNTPAAATTATTTLRFLARGTKNLILEWLDTLGLDRSLPPPRTNQRQHQAAVVPLTRKGRGLPVGQLIKKNLALHQRTFHQLHRGNPKKSGNNKSATATNGNGGDSSPSSEKLDLNSSWASVDSALLARAPAGGNGGSGSIHADSEDSSTKDYMDLEAEREAFDAPHE